MDLLCIRVCLALFAQNLESTFKVLLRLIRCFVRLYSEIMSSENFRVLKHYTEWLNMLIACLPCL